MYTTNKVIKDGPAEGIANTCPVCDYAMSDTPSDYNICPRCGTEFGNDDDTKTHAELRAEWIANGSKFFFMPKAAEPASLVVATVSFMERICENCGNRYGNHHAVDPDGTATCYEGGEELFRYVHPSAKDEVPPVVVSAEETIVTLCEEHGFRDCSICFHDESRLPSPTNDGFREWLNDNGAGMEGEDDLDALMHVSWRAALLKKLSTHPAPLPSDDTREELFRAAKEAYVAMAGNNNPFDAELWSKAVLGLEWAIALAESRAALPVGEKESFEQWYANYYPKAYDRSELKPHQVAKEAWDAAKAGEKGEK